MIDCLSVAHSMQLFLALALFVLASMIEVCIWMWIIVYRRVLHARAAVHS